MVQLQQNEKFNSKADYSMLKLTVIIQIIQKYLIKILDQIYIKYVGEMEK